MSHVAERGMKGAAVLFTQISPDIDWEDRFNAWSDTHHIPRRLEVPGFLSAQRYKDTERETYLALFELEAAETLDSEAFANVEDHPNPETRWVMANAADYARYVGVEIGDQRRDGLDVDPLDAPILYSVFFSVPDERVDEFNDWYTGEHVPMLLRCRDWLSCRRFLIHDGEPQPWTHLALHYIADMSAFDSAERDAARNTDWRKRLEAEPWFQAGTVIFRRHGDRFRAAR